MSTSSSSPSSSCSGSPPGRAETGDFEADEDLALMMSEIHAATSELASPVGAVGRKTVASLVSLGHDASSSDDESSSSSSSSGSESSDDEDTEPAVLPKPHFAKSEGLKSLLQQEKLLNNSKTELAAKDALIAQLRHQLNDPAIATLRADLARLTDLTQSQKRDLATATAAHKTRVSDLERTLAALRADNKRLSADIGLAKVDRDRGKVERDAWREEKRRFEGRIRVLEGEVREEKKKAEGAVNAAAEATREVGRANAARDTAVAAAAAGTASSKESVSTSSKSLSRSVTDPEVTLLQQQLRDSQSACRHAQDDLRRLSQTNTRLTADVDRLQTELDVSRRDSMNQLQQMQLDKHADSGSNDGSSSVMSEETVKGMTGQILVLQRTVMQLEKEKLVLQDALTRHLVERYDLASTRPIQSQQDDASPLAMIPTSSSNDAPANIPQQQLPQPPPSTSTDATLTSPQLTSSTARSSTFKQTTAKHLAPPEQQQYQHSKHSSAATSHLASSPAHSHSSLHHQSVGRVRNGSGGPGSTTSSLSDGGGGDRNEAARPPLVPVKPKRGSVASAEEQRSTTSNRDAAQLSSRSRNAGGNSDSAHQQRGRMSREVSPGVVVVEKPKLPVVASLSSHSNGSSGKRARSSDSTSSSAKHDPHRSSLSKRDLTPLPTTTSTTNSSSASTTTTVAPPPSKKIKLLISESSRKQTSSTSSPSSSPTTTTAPRTLGPSSTTSGLLAVRSSTSIGGGGRYSRNRDADAPPSRPSSSNGGSPYSNSMGMGRSPQLDASGLSKTRSPRPESSSLARGSGGGRSSPQLNANGISSSSVRSVAPPPMPPTAGYSSRTSDARPTSSDSRPSSSTTLAPLANHTTPPKPLTPPNLAHWILTADFSKPSVPRPGVGHVLSEAVMSVSNDPKSFGSGKGVDWVMREVVWKMWRQGGLSVSTYTGGGGGSSGNEVWEWGRMMADREEGEEEEEGKREVVGVPYRSGEFVVQEGVPRGERACVWFVWVVGCGVQGWVEKVLEWCERVVEEGKGEEAQI
ncbi:hypothetical protein HDU98_004060, partial [Podochytrium sp. JEL0797]